MSMATLVHSIRQKSERDRERIAVLIAFGVTALLIALWVMDFRISSDASSADASKAPTPIESLTANMKDIWGKASARFK